MVSSDLTSHIPSQEGWSLKQRAERGRGRDRGLEGVDRNGVCVCVYTPPRNWECGRGSF